jgi:hypothetical protein
MPIIQPNNTTGLYGVDTTVSVGNTLFATNLNISNNAFVGNTITAVGNITTSGFFVGNFAGNVTGNILVPGSNTQVIFNNNGLAGASADLTFNDATNVLSTSGNVTAAGNISGNYILGNGSQLTGLPATYGNANVTTLLASFGSNTISSTGNITTTANIAGGFILGNGSQLSGLPATYSNANVTTLLAAFGSNSISTTGNVTASYFAGDGSLLTNINAGNITGAYGNANVANFLSNFGSNSISTTGNVTANNITASANVDVGAYTKIRSDSLTIQNLSTNGTVTADIINGVQISASGNITGGNLDLGVGGNVQAYGFKSGSTTLLAASTLVSFAGNPLVLGSYNTGNTSGNALVVADGANGIIQLYSPTVANDGWIFNNGTGNLTLPGNTSAINYANGTSILANSYGNSNVSNFLANFGSNIVVTTGNITGGNLVASANLTSTQQTVIGTANVGTTGNIVVSGKNIATDMAFSPDGGNAATAATSRVVVGTGWNGNISHSAQQQRFLVSDTYNRTNTATSVRLLAAEALINLTGNVTNGSTRNQALGGSMRIGGGASANTISLGQGAGNIFSVAGGQFNLDIGNLSPYNLGNTTLSHVAVNGGALLIQAGSTVLNAYGINCLVGPPVGGSSGNVGNIIGYSLGMNLQTVPTGNVYAFYHGSNATGGITSVPVLNQIRQAPQYYAFYNADDLAQIQLGSLRRYHEFESATATSGSFAIDKNTAQVHNIVPTGNCTITGYSNMVVSVSDGSTSDAQIDTLTIIVEQGATPYTVTLPTGTAYKYAGNSSTVGATANSVTMISVTAANVSGTTTYLTTVSPEFV